MGRGKSRLLEGAMSWFNNDEKKYGKAKKKYEEGKKVIHLKDGTKDTHDDNYDDYDEDELVDKLRTLETTITELKAKKDFEIELLRKQADANTAFLQSIIIKLIEKPTAPALPVRAPYNPSSASVKDLVRELSKPDSSDPTAGPKGKLP